MSVKAKIAEQLRTRERVKKVKVFNEEVNVKLLSIKAMENIQLEESNEQVAKFLAEQFLDPESGENIFTQEMFLEELTGEESLELLQIFLKANGRHVDIQKDIEKN